MLDVYLKLSVFFSKYKIISLRNIFYKNLFYIQIRLQKLNKKISRYFYKSTNVINILFSLVFFHITLWIFCILILGLGRIIDLRLIFLVLGRV